MLQGDGLYADDNVTTGRVTQAKQASMEKPDKTCHWEINPGIKPL
jgi:hypothetical protein